MVYYNLAAAFRNRIADPLYVISKYDEENAHRDIELTTHTGQECDIVIEGHLKVQVGEHIAVLGPGDSIYYDSSTPHGMIAVDGRDCLFYAIVLNPTGEPVPELAEARPTTQTAPKDSRTEHKQRVYHNFIDYETNENGTPTSIKFKNTERFNFAFDVVDAIAEKAPDKTAMVHISKDKKWKYASEYGMLDITINRSKPEKDPQDIAAARNQKAAAYPKCQLCPENAGFAGNPNHPARQNLRPIPMQIDGQNWELQYSPYGYYHEHCIVFNDAHVPMKVDHAIFEKLFDVLDFLPHYFIGSNADLPIVGGSILSHEHFQGGHYTFPMAVAPIEIPVSLEAYPNVQAGILKWPMSVVRLSSTNRKELSDACNTILEQWRSYSDATVGIYAETDGTPHNTITPIARKKGDAYECDLVLRNNRTSEDRPLGIFHPNPSLHHIKKENIGLIEVMGLAVLPARLAVELDVLKKAMLQQEDLTANPQTASHAVWAAEVQKQHPEFCEENAEAILQAEVGKVFEQVLCDAGVFKRDEAGKTAFLKFLQIFA